MRRRTFLQQVGMGALFVPAWLPSQSLVPLSQIHYPQGFLLSSQGCGRATGYAEANKIVSVGDKTHVTWLDSSRDGFEVKIRSYNHSTTSWGPTHTLGEAHDNHGGAALTVDSKGYLHVVYFPHHHPMRYRRSLFPNDSSAWEKEISFGKDLTYPTLLCDPHDRLIFSARRSYPNRPWEVELWTKELTGTWELQGTIISARYTGYAHFQESLAWGPGQKTLHLCCRIHEKTDQEAYGRLQTVGYMRSHDAGKTWGKYDGTPLSSPTHADQIDKIAWGGVDVGTILRAGAMAVDRQGRPHILYSREERALSRTFLAKPGKGGQWDSIPLDTLLPKELGRYSLSLPGGISFSSKNDMFIVAQLLRRAPDEVSWGHPSSEVIMFQSQDGGRSFTVRQLSPSNLTIPHWLPNIERPTGFNSLRDTPTILYTAGTKGATNEDLLSNEVWAILDP